MSIQRTIIIIVAVIAGAALVVGGLELSNTTHFFHSNTASSHKSGINYEPPTNAQQNAAGTNNAKDSDSTNNLPSQGTNTSNSNKSKQDVVVLITTWAAKNGYMTVNGRVDGVIETGGTCTLTLTKGNVKKSASRPSEPNATDTSCGQSLIPLSSLSPGEWQAQLSYSSTTSFGTSQSTTVEVPNE